MPVDNHIEYTYKLSETNSLFLDFVRLIASEVVLIGHGIYILNVYPAFQEPHFPRIQNTAVLIFFILSGFLISYSTFRKMSARSYGFIEYFIDRFSRIYTGLIPCLLFIALIDWTILSFSAEDSSYLQHFGNSLSSWDFLGNVLMLQDSPILTYITGTNVSVFGSGVPLWTLAIEWWIYMSFGWFVLVRTNRKVLYWMVGILISIAPFYHLVYGMASRTLGLAAIWLLGLGLTFLLRDRSIQQMSQDKKLIWAILFLVFASITLFVYLDGFHPLTGILYTMSFLFFISFFQEKEIRISPAVKKSIRLGAGFSYTLYLTHYSVLFFMLFAFPNFSDEFNYWMGILVSNVVAFGLAWFTEMRYRTIAIKLKEIFLH